MSCNLPLVEVALTPPIPGMDCLTYEVPDALVGQARTGTRVRVPLGRGTRTGVVVRTLTEQPPTSLSLKPIAECLDPDPFLDSDVLRLCAWASRYYMASLAEVVATIVPAHVPRPQGISIARLLKRLTPEAEGDLRRRSPRQWQVYQALTQAGPAGLATIRDWLQPARRLAGRGIVEVVRETPGTDGPGNREPAQPVPWLFQPTPEQGRTIDAIEAEITAAAFRVFLLFGVTGSGKTNVYLAAARAALEAGRSVLILIPEIGLTHEIADRARTVFGTRVALLHSALSPGERWAEWTRVRRGEATVVVGPRSAVFAPLRHLGLVVVDEEHDQSYKQEEGIRYHGRDLAVVRAQLAGCPVVLGSATPSVESFHNAERGQYTLLELPERAKGQALPTVSLVDARDGTSRARSDLCCKELQAAIEATHQRREQTLLFLNRRGFSQFVQCLACGEPITCSACSVSLTLHLARRALVCHHCGLVRSSELPCAQCGAPLARGRAAGTEQIEQWLGEAFPDMRIARMDRDTTGRRGTQARLLRAWHAGEIDVLIGTQMVTKGIDNPRVTLVGVLNSDISLNLPDFRAAERTFQLVSQVSGRAGRGDAPGVVLVQTIRPEHYSLQAAAAHDYRAFYAAEIEFRRALGYPPFRRLINIRLEAQDPTTAERIARDLAARLRGRDTADSDGIDVMGPAPAPIERLRGWHRWQVLLRGTSSAALRVAVEHGLREVHTQRRARRVRIIVDVDPCSML